MREENNRRDSDRVSRRSGTRVSGAEAREKKERIRFFDEDRAEPQGHAAHTEQKQEQNARRQERPQEDAEERGNGRAGAPRPKRPAPQQAKGGDPERFLHQVVPYVMFWVALFAAVSFFLRDILRLGESAGAFGNWFADFLGGLFGPAAYLVPVFLVVLAIRWKSFVVKGVLPRKLILSTLFVWLLSGIIHVFLDPARAYRDFTGLYAAGAARTGGGVFGGFLGEWMGYLVRLPGTILLACPLLVIIGIYLVGLTPTGLWQRVKYKTQSVTKQSRARKEALYDGTEQRAAVGGKKEKQGETEVTPYAEPQTGIRWRDPRPLSRTEPMRYEFRERDEEPRAPRASEKDTREKEPPRTQPSAAQSKRSEEPKRPAEQQTPPAARATQTPPTEKKPELIDIPDDVPETAEPHPAAQTILTGAGRGTDPAADLDAILSDVLARTAAQTQPAAQQQPAAPQPAAQPQPQAPEEPKNGTYYAPFALPVRPEPKRERPDTHAAGHIVIEPHEAAASEPAKTSEPAETPERPQADRPAPFAAPAPQAETPAQPTPPAQTEPPAAAPVEEELGNDPHKAQPTPFAASAPEPPVFAGSPAPAEPQREHPASFAAEPPAAFAFAANEPERSETVPEQAKDAPAQTADEPDEAETPAVAENAEEYEPAPVQEADDAPDPFLFSPAAPSPQPEPPAPQSQSFAFAPTNAAAYDDLFAPAEPEPKTPAQEKDADEPAPACAETVDEWQTTSPADPVAAARAYLDETPPAPRAAQPTSVSPAPAPSVTVHVERVKAEPTPAPAPPPPPREYRVPPLSLLREDTGAKDTDHTEEMREKSQLLRDTLNSFNVHVKDEVECFRGPTITRYEVRPEIGTSVRSVMNRIDDLSLAMAAPVRIDTQVMGKSAIGIEVPNAEREMVYMRTMLESDAFKNSKKPLEVPIGVDLGGTIQMCNLAKMPHLLIAGTTGSGKSVCINTILVGLLYKNSPADLRLILIDPKQVEFTPYEHIPHLYAPIVVDAKRAVGALACAVNEMERRFSLMRDVGMRNIEGYNEVTKDDPEKEHLPYMVIVIDEFADLMMTAGADAEKFACRLAAKARAAGIHMIIGTQRPSVDVVTGQLKNNIPSRIAFTVRQQIDSRTILDANGAECLTGRGDMLYAPMGVSRPIRAQGAFMDEEEVERVTMYVREYNDPVQYSQSFMDQLEVEMARAENGKRKGADDFEDYSSDASAADGEDPKFWDAVKVAIETRRVATSLLQRRIGVGYGRAAKIIDRMEELGFVSAPDGNKPRQVLITEAQYMEHLMRGGGTENPPEPDEFAEVGEDDFV